VRRRKTAIKIAHVVVSVTTTTLHRLVMISMCICRITYIP